MTDPNVTALHDSGQRSVFDSGAVRDASIGKGFPHMIPPLALARLAQHFENGARKYSAHNWMKGMPLSRFLDSLLRHAAAWAQGDTTEDHAAAVLWNMACAMWTEEQVKSLKLPRVLDDLPYRMTRNGLVYLAAPYSHPDPKIREARFQKINAFAAELMARGVYLYSPISHTHPIAMAGDLPTGWEFWEGYDRAMLAACSRVVIYQLDGWEESKGVQAEIGIAKEMGIPIDYQPTQRMDLFTQITRTIPGDRKPQPPLVP